MNSRNLEAIASIGVSGVNEKMATTGESIRKLLLAYSRADDQAFREAAAEFIAEERRKNHHILANDLERILNGPNGAAPKRIEVLRQLGYAPSDLPCDKERGLPLVEVSEPQRELEDLVLEQKVRDALDRLINEQRHGDTLRTHGLRPISKVLFCGPPGCGKTVAAEAVAKQLYLPLVLARFDAVVSSYLGETSANLRKVFDFAGRKPMAMLFDEFDAVGKHRTAEEEHGELKRVVNSFLQMLDGYRGEAMLIAATNHQGLLDPALWRRFDEIVFFDKPDAKAIESLLVCRLRQIGVEASLSLGEIAKGLVGMSHGDVERIALDAIKDTILADQREVKRDVFTQCVQRQKQRVAVTKYDEEKTRTRRSARSKRTSK